MILDSSAVIAIILDEPERPAFVGVIAASGLVGVGSPTLVESGIVLARRLGADPERAIGDMLRDLQVTVVEFGAAHWQVALRAWDAYGKGRHPARLNLGDCMAYATAKVAGRPLLAKGDDFARTDIELAWRSDGASRP